MKIEKLNPLVTVHKGVNNEVALMANDEKCGIIVFASNTKAAKKEMKDAILLASFIRACMVGAM